MPYALIKPSNRTVSRKLVENALSDGMESDTISPWTNLALSTGSSLNKYLF